MDRFHYYPLLLALALLTIVIGLRTRKQTGTPGQRVNLSRIASALVLLILCLALYYQVHVWKEWDIRKDRNFYGVLTLQRRRIDNADSYVLRHGQTLHGTQQRESPKSPTTYYGPNSGIGLLLSAQATCTPSCSRSYGIVGMGVGTLAAYGHPGDRIRFYEINPQVIAYSQGDSPFFTFLRDTAAKTEVVRGDGRLSLERELREQGSQRFDVLIVDAFNSDSIPIHLLTEEAFQLYLSHLRGPDSVLAFNISNKSIDLSRVLANHALRNKMYVIRLNKPQGPGLDDLSNWMLLSRSRKALEVPGFQGHIASLPLPESVLRWTDDYSNVFQVLRKRW
jgi:hypothetical protein